MHRSRAACFNLPHVPKDAPRRESHDIWALGNTPSCLLVLGDTRASFLQRTDGLQHLQGARLEGGAAASKPKERRRSIVAAGTTHAAEKVDHAASTSSLIGYFSSHGWEQKPGKKDVKPKVNQDRIFITPNLCGDETAGCLGL